MHGIEKHIASHHASAAKAVQRGTLVAATRHTRSSANSFIQLERPFPARGEYRAFLCPRLPPASPPLPPSSRRRRSLHIRLLRCLCRRTAGNILGRGRGHDVDRVGLVGLVHLLRCCLDDVGDGGGGLELALVGPDRGETAGAYHQTDLLVVIHKAIAEFCLKSRRGQFVEFSTNLLLDNQCTSIRSFRSSVEWKVKVSITRA
jgi:hypothetical protein